MSKKLNRIDFRELRDLEKDIRKQAQTVDSEGKKAVVKALLLVKNEAVDNTRAGKLYSTGIYLTGNLRRSISFNMVGAYAGIVSPNTDYARAVEFGYKRRMAKPYMYPALEAKTKEINDLFVSVLDRVKKGIAKL